MFCADFYGDLYVKFVVTVFDPNIPHVYPSPMCHFVNQSRSVKGHMRLVSRWNPVMSCNDHECSIAWCEALVFGFFDERNPSHFRTRFLRPSLMEMSSEDDPTETTPSFFVTFFHFLSWFRLSFTLILLLTRICLLVSHYNRQRDFFYLFLTHSYDWDIRKWDGWGIRQRIQICSLGLTLCCSDSFRRIFSVSRGSLMFIAFLRWSLFLSSVERIEFFSNLWKRWCGGRSFLGRVWSESPSESSLRLDSDSAFFLLLKDSSRFAICFVFTIVEVVFLVRLRENAKKDCSFFFDLLGARHESF